ncbi:NAD(P)H-dependent oxidoreductase subunit E [Cyanobium sp. Aljojuca 7D2]|uniref:NAD(P)H-dependent oxidoreductase subunit E n=1 Tax=Cyanobium sp. Aljojuca 7D2 TaxID=2823698 RepID=UPI0020CDCF82|nr:NAD(P)H-dependent oxidoreductase subunit E [Cyanobium sp. Aljojuca 7D2]
MATTPEPRPSHGLGDSLIERLHAVQQAHGYLPREDLQRLAVAMAWRWCRRC